MNNKPIQISMCMDLNEIKNPGVYICEDTRGQHNIPEFTPIIPEIKELIHDHFNKKGIKTL